MWYRCRQKLAGLRSKSSQAKHHNHPIKRPGKGIQARIRLASVVFRFESVFLYWSTSLVSKSRYSSGCLEPMAHYETDTVPGALTVESPPPQNAEKSKKKKIENDQHVTALGGGWSALLFMIEKLSNQKTEKQESQVSLSIMVAIYVMSLFFIYDERALCLITKYTMRRSPLKRFSSLAEKKNMSSAP